MNKEYNTKKELFTVPEGYFEQLNKEILSATVENKTTTLHRKNHIIGNISRVMGYAAAIALLFMATKNILMPGNDTNGNIALTDNNNTQSEYIDNILDSYSIDDYTFYCYLTNSDFE